MRGIVAGAVFGAFLILSSTASAQETKKAAPMRIVTLPEPGYAAPPPGRGGGIPAQALAAIIAEGNALAGQKRYPEAIAAYSRAIAINPNLDVLWYNRGLAHAGLGQANYGFAWDDFSRAIELNPGNDRAFLGRALVNLQARRRHYYHDDLNMAARLGNQHARKILEEAAARGAGAATP